MRLTSTANLNVFRRKIWFILRKCTTDLTCCIAHFLLWWCRFLCFRVILLVLVWSAMRCSRHEGHVFMSLGMWEADKAAVSGEFAPGWLRLSCGLISDPVILDFLIVLSFWEHQYVIKSLWRLFSFLCPIQLKLITFQRMISVFHDCMLSVRCLNKEEVNEFTNWKKKYSLQLYLTLVSLCAFSLKVLFHYQNLQ